MIQINNIKEHLETDEGLINEKLSHPYSQMRLFALERFNNFLRSKQKNESSLEEIDNEISEVLSLLNPKIDKLKSLACIYGSLWVSYSHYKNITIELNQIEGICDPVHLSEVITKSGTKKNKSKYFEKKFISIIESKECNFSLSEKSDLLDKISLVASADSELHEKEREVLYKVAKLLDMPKTYVDAIIKKMSS